MLKKILIIAYFTPPCGAVGAVRVTKFIKYLLKLGWDVTIVSVRKDYYSELNNRWLEEINGAKVIRTKTLSIPFPGLNEQGFYWYPFLQNELNNLLLNESFSVSFWTGGPFYQWPLARKLYQKYGLKYVLDFRDPWSLHPYRPESILAKARDYVNRKLEERVLKHASFAINVTEQGTSMYKAAYPKYNEKFVTLPNGFDPEDFIEIGSKRISSFDIIYTGKFGSFRNPLPFFKAFQNFVRKYNLSRESIQFVWIGSIEKHIASLLEENVDERYYHITGYMPYNEVIQYLNGASLCLLIVGNHPYEPTTKIFDYLALKKPILAVSNVQGFVSDTLSNLECSRIGKNNETDIERELEHFYFAHKQLFSEDRASTSIIDRFNREENTKLLQEWLIQAIESTSIKDDLKIN